MKIALSALSGLLLSATLANAAVLDFETTSRINTWGTTLTDGFSMPSSSNPTNASGVFNSQNSIVPGGAQGGSNYALNFNSRIGTLERDSAFDLESFWVHADARAGTTSVLFRGLDSIGNVLYSTQLSVSVSWQQVSLNWAGISTFTWDPLNPNVSNVGIDTVTYDEVAPVPLPAGLPLMLGGLAVMGGLRLRKRA